MVDVSFVVVAATLGIASFTDVTRFKVYNALTFPVLFSGVFYQAWVNGWPGVQSSIFGVGIGFLVLLLPYLMGGLGAGDVKFVMAIGAWVGPVLLVPAIVIGCIAVFVYYYVALGSSGGLRSISDHVSVLAMRLVNFSKNLTNDDSFESVQSAARDPSSANRNRLIPFSAMMSIGIVVTFCWMWFVGN